MSHNTIEVLCYGRTWKHLTHRHRDVIVFPEREPVEAFNARLDEMFDYLKAEPELFTISASGAGSVAPGAVALASGNGCASSANFFHQSVVIAAIVCVVPSSGLRLLEAVDFLGCPRLLYEFWFANILPRIA